MRKVTILVEDHFQEEEETILLKSTVEIKSSNSGHAFFEAIHSGQEIFGLAQKVERFTVLKDTCSQEEFIA